MLVEGKTELPDSVAKTKRLSLWGILTSDGRFEKNAVTPPLVVPLLPLVVLLVLVLVLVLLVFMMAVSIAVMIHHDTITMDRQNTYTAQTRTYLFSFFVLIFPPKKHENKYYLFNIALFPAAKFNT